MYATPEESSRCCSTCKHYVPMDRDELELHTDEDSSGECGRCTRFPPVFFYQKLLNGEFPVVQAEMCCGEYSPWLPDKHV